jgi:hypothetical protein
MPSAGWVRWTGVDPFDGSVKAAAPPAELLDGRRAGHRPPTQVRMWDRTGVGSIGGASTR